MAFLHKNIRLSAPNYKGHRWHFITICCENRLRSLVSHGLAVWIINELREHASLNQFAIHALCVMPDHVHALVHGLTETSDLLVFVKKFKQQTGYRFKRSRGRDLWQKKQKKFYDHILRSTDSVDGVAAYIWMNPVRKGLCKEPREYPYSGSFTLDWPNIPFSREGWIPPWKGKAPA